MCLSHHGTFWRVYCFVGYQWTANRSYRGSGCCSLWSTCHPRILMTIRHHNNVGTAGLGSHDLQDDVKARVNILAGFLFSTKSAKENRRRANKIDAEQTNKTKCVDPQWRQQPANQKGKLLQDVSAHSWQVRWSAKRLGRDVAQTKVANVLTKRKSARQ